MLVWYGLVWFGLVGYGSVRSGLRQHPFEASVKVSSRFDLFWLFYRGFSVSLVWYGLVWFSWVWFGLV